LKSIIQYRGYRMVRGTTTKTGRYYGCSSDMNADECYRYLRGHWSIENRLHWSLDVLCFEKTRRG
jgi:predicted transposase YbfD/YdcC